MDFTSPYLEIKVLVRTADPTIRPRVEEALAGKAVRLARIEAVSCKKEGEKRVVTYEDFKNTLPAELMKEVYCKECGEEMPESIEEMLNSVIKEAAE